jgi:carbon monoxide dehydrogenase subunit G
MEIHETATIDVPISRVWSALNDPSVLKLCVPGCQEIKVIDANTYSAKATIKVGFISSKFNDIRVKKLGTRENEFLSFEMVGEDSNKIGSFKQTLQIKMSEPKTTTTENHSTTIDINAAIELKGKFATLGKRVVEWKAKKVTEEFIENLRKLAK